MAAPCDPGAGSGWFSPPESCKPFDSHCAAQDASPGLSEREGRPGFGSLPAYKLQCSAHHAAGLLCEEGSPGACANLHLALGGELHADGHVNVVEHLFELGGFESIGHLRAGTVGSRRLAKAAEDWRWSEKARLHVIARDDIWEMRSPELWCCKAITRESEHMHAGGRCDLLSYGVARP